LKGNSLLDLKNKLLVQYLHNLSYFVLLKINGQKIDGQQCIQRLAELRCVFEKIRPIEAKLKYQIDKYIKLAENKMQDANDPLNFKPTTEDFESENEKEEDESEDDENKEDGIYRPPKLAPVYCDVDETAKNKLETKIERIKRHALNSSLMKDLQKQYSEAPEELFVS
jgi:U3 small nucleolar ribonucleoprotein protein LCP5